MKIEEYGMEKRKYTLNSAKHASKMAEWRIRIGECRNSGQTIKEWCKEKHICLKTYYRWQRSSILRRGRPRSDHSERTLYAGAGGACPSPGSPRQPARQEAQFFLQSLFCTDGFLRRLRRTLQARPLEQPGLQVHCLAVLLAA